MADIRDFHDSVFDRCKGAFHFCDKIINGISQLTELIVLTKVDS
ncbi:Uncharacterised protein [Vibrio cholerae]|nr:Uncharacterised protein [Vibrio cholerae]CSI89829.1 Uncharacterised protein [Vibrio cholerae]